MWPPSGVAQRRHADARHEIQVRAALRVEQVDTLAAAEHDRLPAIGLKHVPRLEGLHVSG